MLWGYGTGAIMAVPAHDERDFLFAKKFGLEIVEVVVPIENNSVEQNQPLQTDSTQAFTAPGKNINSSNETVSLNNLPTADAKEKIISWVEKNRLGKKRIQFKLRDWLFSRQRYWGEPIPIIHLEDGTMKALRESDLPLVLPELQEFKPSGTTESPLSLATDWVSTIDPDTGKPARRETNTMPQWAGSCWYYMRYLDPHNANVFCDAALEQYWMPVDLYIGGSEHAVLHLLYARFWHKVLFDLGFVSTDEPFTKLVHQGMILGEMEFTGYQNAAGGWVSASEVKLNEDNKPIEKKSGSPVTAVKLQAEQTEKQGEGFVLIADHKIRIDSRAYKMSKSRGNVVNPDHVVKEYGDALRLYEMFMGPLEATKPWSMTGVNGVRGSWIAPGGSSFPTVPKKSNSIRHCKKFRQPTSRTGFCTKPSPRSRKTSNNSASTRQSQS